MKASQNADLSIVDVASHNSQELAKHPDRPNESVGRERVNASRLEQASGMDQPEPFAEMGEEGVTSAVFAKQKQLMVDVEAELVRMLKFIEIHVHQKLE